MIFLKKTDRRLSTNKATTQNRRFYRIIGELVRRLLVLMNCTRGISVGFWAWMFKGERYERENDSNR